MAAGAWSRVEGPTNQLRGVVGGGGGSRIGNRGGDRICCKVRRGIRLRRRCCNSRNCSQAARVSVDELPREASGVRPACWRCRKVGVVGKREQAPRTPDASRSSVAALPRCAHRSLASRPARSAWQNPLRTSTRCQGVHSTSASGSLSRTGSGRSDAMLGRIRESLVLRRSAGWLDRL